MILQFYWFIFWPCNSACWILVPDWGSNPDPPAVDVQNLHHWTAREVPEFTLWFWQLLWCSVTWRLEFRHLTVSAPSGHPQHPRHGGYSSYGDFWYHVDYHKAVSITTLVEFGLVKSWTLLQCLMPSLTFWHVTYMVVLKLSSKTSKASSFNRGTKFPIFTPKNAVCFTQNRVAFPGDQPITPKWGIVMVSTLQSYP